MRIAVDAMGGDHAPRVVVEGALLSLRETGARLSLVGDRDAIEAELERQGVSSERIGIVHADEVVAMDDHPITPIRKKRRSSIRICAELVRAGDAQALVSAGNTGATMIAAKMIVGTITGVNRPALAGLFPNQGGSRTVVLDVGANVGAKAAHLREFAVMGHFYAQEMVDIPKPRIGLMSIGEEEAKGTDFTKSVYKVLQTTGLNFIGNVEGGAAFDASADVVVCDGFVGNAILKASESVVEMLFGTLKAELEGSLASRVGMRLAGSALRRTARQAHYSAYGGAPLLGLQGGCFVAHGRSNGTAIKNLILRAAEFCEADMHIKIRDKVAELHSQEERLLGSREPQEVGA